MTLGHRASSLSTTAIKILTRNTSITVLNMYLSKKLLNYSAFCTGNKTVFTQETCRPMQSEGNKNPARVPTI